MFRAARAVSRLAVTVAICQLAGLGRDPEHGQIVAVLDHQARHSVPKLGSEDVADDSLIAGSESSLHEVDVNQKREIRKRNCERRWRT